MANAIRCFDTLEPQNWEPMKNAVLSSETGLNIGTAHAQHDGVDSVMQHIACPYEMFLFLLQSQATWIHSSQIRALKLSTAVSQSCSWLCDSSSQFKFLERTGSTATPRTALSGKVVIRSGRRVPPHSQVQTVLFFVLRSDRLTELIFSSFIIYVVSFCLGFLPTVGIALLARAATKPSRTVFS